MIQSKKSESGQALVLIVLGIAVLLGFTALAIDGGRIYTDRRAMQNASDTSSLTGAGRYAQYFTANEVYYSNWSCSGSWFNSATALAVLAAIDRASSNGYVIDSDIDDNNGVAVSCQEIDYGGFSDKYIEVETHITAETPSSFARFVFPGALVQTVQSVARIRPQTSLAFGHAIVALNPAGCEGNQNGVQFDGSFDVYVNGGGVLSNGCLGTGGSGDVIVDDGSISYGDEWISTGPGDVSPNPTENSAPLPESVTEVPPPDCSGLTNYGNANSGGNLSPGAYTQIAVGANEDAFLAPGLYCVSGDVSVAGQGSLVGANVTIYVINGDFDTNGGSYVSLTAPLPDPDPDPALPGILIYLAEGNTGSVNLLGNSDSKYVGTVFAPNGTIEVGGTASDLATYNTQLIGWNVFIHGSPTIDLNFTEGQSYQSPPNLDLQR